MSSVSKWLETEVTVSAQSPLPPGALPEESRFYGNRRWCLDAFPTIKEARRRLASELGHAETVGEEWPRQEVMTNIFLLGCALADTADDYLAGEPWDFSRAAGVLPGLRPVTAVLDRVLGVVRWQRAWRLRGLRRWRKEWGSALDAFLQAWLAAGEGEPAPAARTLEALARVLFARLPRGLLAQRVKVPAAFRSQDLTHHDVVALASRFAASHADRRRALLVVGLRTAGSYFAPVLRAALAAQGFEDVESVTLRPKQRLTPEERQALERGAVRKALALVVDEPADTGQTLTRVMDALRRAAVPARDVVVLLPVHPTRRDWQSGHEWLAISRARVLALAPEEWRKHRQLEPDRAQGVLSAYFQERGYARVDVRPSAAAEAFNRQLRHLSEEKFHTRLKRVYEVRLRGADGRTETRYVLAKSVGWGWLGYHAFLAAQALSDFVPPLLGLREGVLYTEWLPQADRPSLPRDREGLLGRVAAYVSARVRWLGLEVDPGATLEPRYQKGGALLASVLSRAYGWKPTAILKRADLRRRLSRRPCPLPTLIDGKMRLQEWVRAPGSLLKTDFEHHGLGKTELNVTDPAYDLADAILHLGLSPAEEQALLRSYVEECGDTGIEERLFLHKLLAGSAARTAALANLGEPRLRHRHADFNRSYIEAWDFLTAHTVRFCGRLCRPAEPPAWRSRLVVMDLDGVLDKQIFGYPTTTAAGLEALSLLHAHGLALALNTARTLAEVQEYCRAYGGVGGVAEYGSVVWDSVSDRTRVLVSAESRAEMERLGEGLRQIPGVFLNDRYRHSLRAYTYDQARTVPLPSALVRGLMADFGLERLAVHQTYLDTAVVASEVDKGQGLLALLDLAGRGPLETIAIGDSEPDLAMFRVAARSFAPRHISGRSLAQRLGCRIAPRAYQRGLLCAARSIVHPEGGRCARCRRCRPRTEGLFGELLRTADRAPLSSLLRAAADPLALRALVR